MKLIQKIEAHYEICGLFGFGDKKKVLKKYLAQLELCDMKIDNLTDKAAVEKVKKERKKIEDEMRRKLPSDLVKEGERWLKEDSHSAQHKKREAEWKRNREKEDMAHKLEMERWKRKKKEWENPPKRQEQLEQKRYVHEEEEKDPYLEWRCSQGL